MLMTKMYQKRTIFIINLITSNQIIENISKSAADMIYNSRNISCHVFYLTNSALWDKAQNNVPLSWHKIITIKRLLYISMEWIVISIVIIHFKEFSTEYMKSEHNIAIDFERNSISITLMYC